MTIIPIIVQWPNRVLKEANYLTVRSFYRAKNEWHLPFVGKKQRENGVLRPGSGHDSAQGKAYVTKVGHSYSFTTRSVLRNGTILSNIVQDQRAVVLIFARNSLHGGAILANCPENERTRRIIVCLPVNRP